MRESIANSIRWLIKTGLLLFLLFFVVSWFYRIIVLILLVLTWRQKFRFRYSW